MSSFGDALKLIGAIAGVAAFTWQIWSSLRSYLVLSMDIRKPEEGEAVIKISVGNSGLMSKLISFAVLTITPEPKALNDAIKGLLDQLPNSPGKDDERRPLLSRLFRHAGSDRRYMDDSVIVPLNELYKDQAMVGPGETVSCVCSIDLSKLTPQTTYVVRFFVFVLYAGVFLRWRFTADALRFSAPARP